MKFEAKGTFVNRGENQAFHTFVEAENEKMASEKVYGNMGSKQGLRRTYILIKEIKMVK